VQDNSIRKLQENFHKLSDAPRAAEDSSKFTRKKWTQQAC
jgi:hypothetical protein